MNERATSPGGASLSLACGTLKRAGFILIIGLCGCVSVEYHAAKRTARLREIYPPGMSKEDVQLRWGRTKPDFSLSRPSGGWAAHPNDYLARKLEQMEVSTGKRIETVDRYWGPDGWIQ